MKTLTRSLILFTAILTASCSGPTDQASEKETVEVDTVETQTDLKEKGHFVFDYVYNIQLRRKKITPHNIFLEKGDSIVKIAGKNDRWEYKIKEVVESSDTSYSIIVHGGNLAVGGKEDYQLTINDGMAKMERLSNNAKWWYITEQLRPAFESELEKAGLIFHR